MINPLAFLRRRQQDYRAAFGGEPGRRVLADLARFCHAADQLHCPGDAYETAFRDGKRRVFLRIAAILNMDPAAMLKLAQEQVPTDD